MDITILLMDLQTPFIMGYQSEVITIPKKQSLPCYFQNIEENFDTLTRTDRLKIFQTIKECFSLPLLGSYFF